MRKYVMMFVLLVSVISIYSQSLTIQTTGGEETIELAEIENITIEIDNMVFIEGGSYLMGDHYNEGWDDELPVHVVNIDDFFACKYEVTHSEFLLFLNDADVDSNGLFNGNLMIDLDDNNCVIEYLDGNFSFIGNNYITSIECPVMGISWLGACEYSNWLSENNDLTPCYVISNNNAECDFSGNGYRLPTEAEWEYTSRGGEYWIDDFRYSGCHEWLDLSDFAWFNYNSASQLHSVGEKLPNQLGIYDMSGNAYELCWDWFSSSYYEVSASENPLGPESGTYHVSRGGDWNDDAQFCRSAARFSSYPYTSGGYLGFRLVKSLQ
jgi:formylglycine-generating enzyme required for sulfatase activity